MRFCDVTLVLQKVHVCRVLRPCWVVNSSRCFESGTLIWNVSRCLPVSSVQQPRKLGCLWSYKFSEFNTVNSIWKWNTLEGRTSKCFCKVQRSVITAAIASRRARVGVAVKWHLNQRRRVLYLACIPHTFVPTAHQGF